MTARSGKAAQAERPEAEADAAPAEPTADLDFAIDLDSFADTTSPPIDADVIEEAVASALGSSPELLAAAVDTLADQVEQLDRLEAATDELRTQFEGVRAHVEGLETGLAQMADAVGSAADPTEVAAALHDDITRLVREVAGDCTLPALAADVQALRQEVNELRRGLAVLAKGGAVNVAVKLDDTQLTRVADLVAARLQDVLEVVPEGDVT